MDEDFAVSTKELENFKIGDRVVGKKTGLLVPSTIVGFIPPQYKPEIYNVQCQWDATYPEWRKKYLVFCEFDEPTKTMRLDEFIQETILPLPETSDIPFVSKVIKDKVLFNQYAEFLYDKMVPPSRRVCYPIEDLELVHEKVS